VLRYDDGLRAACISDAIRVQLKSETYSSVDESWRSAQEFLKDQQVSSHGLAGAGVRPTKSKERKTLGPSRLDDQIYHCGLHN